MTSREQTDLDDLLEIAREEESLLSLWELSFLESLDERCRNRDLTYKQADIFDRLVEKHLR